MLGMGVIYEELAYLVEARIGRAIKLACCDGVLLTCMLLSQLLRRALQQRRWDIFYR